MQPRWTTALWPKSRLVVAESLIASRLKALTEPARERSARSRGAPPACCSVETTRWLRIRPCSARYTCHCSCLVSAPLPCPTPTKSSRTASSCRRRQAAPAAPSGPPRSRCGGPRPAHGVPREVPVIVKFAITFLGRRPSGRRAADGSIWTKSPVRPRPGAPRITTARRGRTEGSRGISCGRTSLPHSRGARAPGRRGISVV
jgi:hypothetical protein